jgi:hypothetical protein
VNNGEGIKLYIQESFAKKKYPLSGSLIELCGFTNVADQKKTIGLLAERKKISEGVIIIPYTFLKNDLSSTPILDSQINAIQIPNDVLSIGAGVVLASNEAERAATIPEILGENGIYRTADMGRGPYYYRIDNAVISKLLGGLNLSNASFEQIKAAAEASPYQSNSIIKMIISMTKYVIPPHLDWLRNKNIQPFVMYIADFQTVFDKEDLSDIWQGVMPKQSRRVEIDNISITHNFGEDEFFHGKQPMSDTKFKVFKVKQRANINYYKLTDDSRDDTRFKFTFGNSQQASIPEYSYNWPYDYFSTVELVNIEAKLTGENPDE